MADEVKSKTPQENEEKAELTKDHKLWIGNLDKRLSEFNLLKILQRFGDIKHFEFLFHNSGPNRGQPRGYCFVEYHKREDATKALQGLNGKMALSKALVVDWAHQQKMAPESSRQENTQKKNCEKISVSSLPSASHDSKIQAIEAKLRLMESSNYSGKTMIGWSKHPLLVESEKNKTHPYKITRRTRKSEWKGKKPR